MKALKVVVAVALMGVLFGAVSTFAQPGCDPYTIPKSDSTFAPEVHHHLVNYQGKLVDYQGKLVHDTLAITFSIYDDSTGGVPLWWETQPAVIVWGGVYSVLLGSVTPMPDTLFKNFPVVNWFERWLGITIGSQSEMKPRQHIAIVGHAMNSDMLDGFHYSAVMEEVKRLIEAMDWGRPQRTCSLYEGNCLPDCDTFRPLIDIYVNEVGPDTMEFDGSTPTFQVKNEGSGDAVYGESDGGYGGHFTSTNDYGLYASGSGGGTNDGSAYFDGDVTVIGNVGIGAEASANFLVKATEGTDDRFTVSNNGQVSITSNIDGAQNNTGAYGLYLDSKDQGMWIKLRDKDYPDNNNNYITFSGSSTGTVRGRIEGETAGDAVNNWVYWYETLMGTANIVVKTGIVAADGVCLAADAVQLAADIADFRACAGLGACVAGPSPGVIAASAAALAASGVLLAADVFDLGTEIANLAVYQATYWSNLGVAFSSGSGDYAEWLQRVDADETLQPGDIVGVYGGKITKCTEGAQQILPVSTSPIVVGNMPQESEEHLYEKVAFMGQVPVKVMGPVKEGDYIIPSGLEDGTGIAVSPELMTADEFSKIVGRAWSASESPSLNVVNVAIGVNSGDVASIVKRQETQNQQLRSQVDGLSQRMAQLEKTLEKVAGKASEEKPSEGIETAQNNTVGDSK